MAEQLHEFLQSDAALEAQRNGLAETGQQAVNRAALLGYAQLQQLRPPRFVRGHGHVAFVTGNHEPVRDSVPIARFRHKGSVPTAARARTLVRVKPRETAAAYVRALYAPDEHVALVLLDRSAQGRRPEQRIFPCEKMASPGTQGWLRHMNAGKYDVFLGQNPMTGTPRAPAAGGPPKLQRKKEDVLRVDRVYLDIDDKGDAALGKILADAADGRIPGPRYAVNTSPGRVQVIWQTPPGALDPERAEALMRGLVAEYGGDRAATDVSRVLRWPGFRNHKREGFLARVVHRDGAALARPEAFPERLYAPRAWEPPRPGERARPTGSGLGRDTSRSGQDWRWTRDRLRSGANSDDVERDLASRRSSDKKDSLDYARRTVANAMESLKMLSRQPQRFER